ncbi:MAG: CRISPR-associated endonuclease Cas2 [Armatimonadota bacterium]
MQILVAYDVNTQTAAGEKRLRMVARACKDYGQRVQHSVFECTLNEAQLEKLRHRLLRIMDPEQDSLRIYHLRGPRDEVVESYGVNHYISFEEPIVL